MTGFVVNMNRGYASLLRIGRSARVSKWIKNRPFAAVNELDCSVMSRMSVASRSRVCFYNLNAVGMGLDSFERSSSFKDIAALSELPHKAEYKGDDDGLPHVEKVEGETDIVENRNAKLSKRIADLSIDKFELKVIDGAEGLRVRDFLKMALLRYTHESTKMALKKKLVWRYSVEKNTIQTIKKDGIILKAGDSIWYPIKYGTPSGKHAYYSKPVKKDTPEALVELLKSRIIFMDENLIAIDKPAGIAVQGGSKQKVSIDDALEHFKFNKSEKPVLVHRLDIDTTGVMLLARTGEMARRVGNLLKERKIGKEYLALVIGAPAKTCGMIKVPMETVEDNNGRRRLIARLDLMGATKDKYEKVKGHSFSAFTEYGVVSSSSEKEASVIRCYPTSGRKHQIRVHLSQVLGTPVLGDYKYGKGISGTVMKRLGIEDDVHDVPLHLHAYGISIPGYYEKKDLHIRCPVPQHFRDTANAFELRLV